MASITSALTSKVVFAKLKAHIFFLNIVNILSVFAHIDHFHWNESVRGFRVFFFSVKYNVLYKISFTALKKTYHDCYSARNQHSSINEFE